VAPQLYCGPGGCPPISVPVAGVPTLVDTYQYVSDTYGLSYDRRWEDVGVLVGFVVGTATLAALSMRYIVWVRR